MATWHQIRGGCPILYHATQWTVVHDPPNDCMSLTRFNTEPDAREYVDAMKARGHEHVYLLKPYPGTTTRRKR